MPLTPLEMKFQNKGLSLNAPQHSSSFKIVSRQKLIRKNLSPSSIASKGRYTTLIIWAITNDSETEIVMNLKKRYTRCINVLRIIVEEFRIVFAKVNDRNIVISNIQVAIAKTWGRVPFDL